MDFIDDDILDIVLIDMLVNTHELSETKVEVFMEFHKDVLLEVLEDTFDKYILINANKLK